MSFESKVKKLYDKDNVEAYKTLLELEIITTESNELYEYFDWFIKMLDSDRSFVRIRGFRLICALAQWDNENKINDNIEDILKVLDDCNGVVVRQCLSKINLLLLYKQELSDEIEYKLKSIDLSKHKESLVPLIKKDIDYIIQCL